MGKEREGNSYRSPQRKLVRFFEKSRDKWKAKARESKRIIKRFKNRVSFLEKSKENWKRKAEELADEIAKMKAEKIEKEKEMEALEKAKKESSSLGCIGVFALTISGHQYSVGQIVLFISLILSASASFRCASHAIEIMLSFLQMPFSAPSWYAGRLWLLRLGYYKLMRAKEPAEDWIWIVDHTVQLGADKCLVILGIRQSSLPLPGNRLSHEDVEPITLVPVTQSNGEIVYQQLEEAVEKTGVPREIIGDHGTDLRSGIDKFCQEHPGTCYIYDIKHKTAAVLKQELEDDPAWEDFTRLAAQTKSRVQQTSLAFIAPPNQRTKARYMNVDILIQWGRKALSFVERQKQGASEAYDQQYVDEKLGWITQFSEHIVQWEEIMQVIITTEKFVREQGLSRGCHLKLKERLFHVVHTERAKKVCACLLSFVAEESFKAKPNERLLGSSEVIESVFGKFKKLEQDQAKSGFTGLLLSVAAMVSTTTVEVVRKALETVRTKEVLDWFKKTLGKSVQARRREAFKSHEETEQKQDDQPVLAIPKHENGPPEDPDIFMVNSRPPGPSASGSPPLRAGPTQAVNGETEQKRDQSELAA